MFFPQPQQSGLGPLEANWVETGRLNLIGLYLLGEFALVFGRESVGLPSALLETYSETCWAIPTLGAVRSLNLSNAVSIVLYEALRALGALGNTFVG